MIIPGTVAVPDAAVVPMVALRVLSWGIAPARADSAAAAVDTMCLARAGEVATEGAVAAAAWAAVAVSWAALVLAPCMLEVAAAVAPAWAAVSSCSQERSGS